MNGDAPADGASLRAVTSKSGRVIAFLSSATELSTNFPRANGVGQVFRHDRKTGATVLVSADASGDASASQCRPNSVSISKSGRCVVFASATNLIGGLGNGKLQIWRRDVKTASTALVSSSITSGFADGDCFESRVGGDGRFVAFASVASNVVGSDSGTDQRIVVVGRKTGARRAVHVVFDAEACDCSSPSLSTKRRKIAFDVRKANGPIAGDDEYFSHVFDRASGALEVASVDSDEVAHSSTIRCEPCISGNAKFVAFASDSSLLGADHDDKSDAFLRSLP